ncbi:MAG: GMC family oxidoreductase [Deltaproteobacteria bacterium]|nr:GMC family oxidoreductase [Deltaproteobacteria bacterium]
MSGRITDASREPLPEELTVEVCVIGSGAGGGTAARVLAEAGREVLLLEEGGDYTGSALTQRDAAMYDQLYMDRGGRSTDDLAIAVLQGRVLGGGTVINACDVVPIDEPLLELWRRRFGLTELTSSALAPARARALADLSASTVEERQLNRANQLVRQGAAALGLRGEIMQHNRVGCAGLGTCLIGCPIGAKRNARTVAIPAAVERGAQVWTRVRAIRIERASEEVKQVLVRSLDARGYREVRESMVRARTVIVAASAVGTPQLLLRSGIGGPEVGEHLSLQPQLPVTAFFDERIEAFRGIPQAFAITEGERFDPERGLSGFRIEPVMGTPGIVASLLPFTGLEAKAMMTQYDHLAAALVLVPDEGTGQVSLTDGGRPRIRYLHEDEHKARLLEGAKMAAGAFLAAGAREVLVPVIPPVRVRSDRDLAEIDRISLAPATAPLLSAHQQGTARMSPSADRGVCDPSGLVFGTRGVFVVDSSLFPTSASTHTMAPIMTFAHHLSGRLVAGPR